MKEHSTPRVIRCAYYGCNRPAVWHTTRQTPTMPAPGFYCVCDEHKTADETWHRLNPDTTAAYDIMHEWDREAGIPPRTDADLDADIPGCSISCNYPEWLPSTSLQRPWTSWRTNSTSSASWSANRKAGV